MPRARLLLLLPTIALALSGCVVGMVAGAASLAGSGSGERRNEAFMHAAARQACSAHAAQYGAVQVTEIRQADAGEIIVSGTVADASGRNSFECSFVTEITGFKLQPVPPAN